jgi:ABC-type Fe3+-citrate transport system substrate-binding protein
MGRQHSKRRKMAIRQKQKRSRKLSKLREDYIIASSGKKEQILKKVNKIAPWLTEEQFLEPIKKQGKKG